MEPGLSVVKGVVAAPQSLLFIMPIVGTLNKYVVKLYIAVNITISLIYLYIVAEMVERLWCL